MRGNCVQATLNMIVRNYLRNPQSNMANIILIPPNSNTFSDWRRTCHVSWVNKYLMTNPRETVSFVSTTTSMWNVEGRGEQNSLFPARLDLWHVTRSPPPNSKLTAFMWRSYIPKLKIAFFPRFWFHRLYRNLAFYNVLARQWLFVLYSLWFLLTEQFLH